jgi:hypothetical protein
MFNGILAGAVACLSVFSTVNGADSIRPFLHPDRISYDSHCLTIDGKDVFIYSGAFHYFRCPKELWRDRFQKIKDAGFNGVETYVAWNCHEKEMPSGLDDFSKVDLTDLDDWLKMAESFGFYIIVRPGPYICAEWDTGGFPQWLLTKKPAKYQGEWLRSDDPTFLAWSKHWYQAVCPVIAKHQITEKSKGKPGVILVQVENEYDFAKFPDKVKIRHIKALVESARGYGIEVPLITCWTHQVRGSTDPVLRQAFDACNFYPRWNVDGELKPNIKKLRAEQPDAPLATTELQGGWFSNVGGKLSEDQDGITAAQINNLTLLAIEHGETLLNYYMLFGGSNPGDSGARTMTTTYDYGAPIREWGGVGDRYQQVWAIGHMLRDHGAKLARAEKVECDTTFSDPNGKPQEAVSVVMRRAQDGSRYLFLRTSQRTEPREGTAHVTPKAGGQEIVFDYKLEPFGSKVLYLKPGLNDAYQGEWLPKAAPAIVRPTTLPPKVEITSVRRQSDPGPSHWTRMDFEQDLAQLGIYDSDFVFYKTAINETVKTNLSVAHPANDGVLITANGKPALKIAEATGSSTFYVARGFSDVMFLYENLGHANGGSAMENPCGISSVRLVAPPDGVKTFTTWRKLEVNGIADRPEVHREFDDASWATVQVDKVEADTLPVGHTAVYRSTVEMSLDDFANKRWTLRFGRIDDQGLVYVNGEKVGESRDWSQEYSFDITLQLRPGINVIGVVVHNLEGAGGIGMPSLMQDSNVRVVRMQALGRPTGIEEEWWKPSLDDDKWEMVNIGAQSAAPSGAMLEWYRMNFKMPSRKSHVWVPWRLHLDAAGNGFLYLNGHPLGRYWQAGPQHDFYLPECWLHGGENLVTLSLRPVDKGAVIKSASVEPYAEFAEKR